MIKIKIILVLLTAGILFFEDPLIVDAKPRIDVINKGGFTGLSDEDMEDTIQALCDKIQKDAGVIRSKTVSCYDWEESPTLAYNTIYCDIICVNLSGFRTSADADAAGETVEYHLLKTMAHEMRHSFQYEHRLDDSDYGKACLLGFEQYESYNGDREAYYKQFLEADAESWATEYADKYFGKKK